MSDWCEKWAVWSRAALPNTQIHQSSGGWGPVRPASMRSGARSDGPAAVRPASPRCGPPHGWFGPRPVRAPGVCSRHRLFDGRADAASTGIALHRRFASRTPDRPRWVGPRAAGPGSPRPDPRCTAAPDHPPGVRNRLDTPPADGYPFVPPSATRCVRCVISIVDGSHGKRRARGDRPVHPLGRGAGRADARRPLRRHGRRDRRGDQHPPRTRVGAGPGPRRGARRGDADRRRGLPRRDPVRPRGAPGRQLDEGGHGHPAAPRPARSRSARSSSAPSRATSTTSARTWSG